MQRLLQDGPVDAGDLDIHLQSGDTVHGTGNLEVHVAQEVFQTLDVGQHGQFAAFLVRNQTHRDARNGSMDRNAGVHQAQR